MGRRSRARRRAATSAAGRQGPAAPVGSARRRRLLGLLNPFRFEPPSRLRVRRAAAGFGLSALLFAVLGWRSGEAAWFNSAALLAILALAWGARAAFMREDDGSRRGGAG